MGKNESLSRWVRRLEADQVLFNEGEHDRTLYVLIDGKVEIVKGTDQVAIIDTKESFIGELAALTGKGRWATARTLTKSTLLMIDDIEDLFKADPSWGLRLARVLAERLDRTNDRFQRLHGMVFKATVRTAIGPEAESFVAELTQGQRDTHL